MHSFAETVIYGFAKPSSPEMWVCYQKMSYMYSTNAHKGRLVYTPIDSCYLIDCAPGYECLVYEETGEGYCSPSCEELNPCARNEQCVLTTVTCIRSPCPPQLSCEGK